MNPLDRKYIKSKLKKRKPFSHKGNYGHALIIAGKKGYMGAAVIAAKSALRTGVGLLTVCVPEDERSIMQCSVPQAMLTTSKNITNNVDKFSAIGIGPGMGTEKDSANILLHIFKHFNKPLLLDADALTVLSNDKKLLNKIPQGTVITPHTGEFDRLFGIHKNNDGRMKTALKKAKEYRIIIVLKGHQTAIVSSEKTYYNPTGNAGLAKGGSGDALTGIITSFLAQGYTSVEAANLGVYFHGLAADITLKEQSMESMIITDVIDNFGKAFKNIRK